MTISTMQTSMAAIKALFTGSATAKPCTKRQVSPMRLPTSPLPATSSQFSTAVRPCAKYECIGTDYKKDIAEMWTSRAAQDLHAHLEKAIMICQSIDHRKHT